ncbi:MAG: HU family DNA-binding protein [Candidatus Bipolaricaulota bacterium]|jgi:DNA-binding protein HU-beta|nr:HU family DNA-binding protein [Candidatus Bipolaricaulota bacterium]MDD5219969.1 HU family DNA-binding protein [Candidatus Bipolaricaulis sp.]
MNKGEFIDRLADKSNLTKKEARKLLDGVLDLIQSTLLEGEEVKLVGFGKFAVRARKASSRINPQTKRPIQVEAKVVPLFKPGKELKRRIEKALKVAPKGVARK